MRIASGGNVGMGTTTPGYKLDVNGEINISGSGNALRWGGSAFHYMALGAGSSDISTFGPLLISLYDGVGVSGYNSKATFTSSSLFLYTRLEVSGSTSVYNGGLIVS